MPELPEVEVTRRGLEPQIAGLCVKSVLLGKPLRWPLGVDPQRLVGRTVVGVSRRGKYLLIALDAGVLLIHLGMSGSLQLSEGPARALRAHEHFGAELGPRWLTLLDPRRFGAVVWADSMQSPQVKKLLQNIGPEPFTLELTADSLWAELKRSRSPIKTVLLAGRAVCGVGNIYASEVLYLARIRPQRPANRVTRPEATRLLAAIRSVLQAAIDAGGSSLRDFRATGGELGHFQTMTRVYGRAGEGCQACGSVIRLARQGQRSSYFCPTCQPR